MTLDPNKLWAKSKGKSEAERPSMRLLRHLQDVNESARRVLDATGADQLRALGLPESTGGRLRHCVLLAAAVHDLGKANDHFQGMILGTRDIRVNPQGLRHEWATVLMLASLREWLLPAVEGSEDDFALVEWAVAGHHPAYNHESPPSGCPKEGGAGPELRLHTEHTDFAETLAWVGREFSLGPAPALPGARIQLTGGRSVFADFKRWGIAAQRRWDRLRHAPEARILAAVKNCLVAADVAGSALPKEGAPDWDRIGRAFADKPGPGELQKVADHRLGKDALRPFQETVRDSNAAVTFVKAGCGTGKTLAAYLWAAKNHPARRLYFCYPTTGTATEGFKDYLFEPDGELGDIGARLFHSRRDVDHEIILTTGRDSPNAEADAALRADALETWGTPVVSCTVDTVLGVVQNNRRGLFGWPALAQAAFVFDEIHAYDDLLFGALLRFLRDLPGLPALLMTASLPAPREEALRRVLRDHRGVELAPIAGPSDLEELPRYHKLTAAPGDVLGLVAEEVRGGGKVLWVCNTVGRVMASADAAKAEGLAPSIYHSRFKYIHRVKRHKAVVDAFIEGHERGALACTSQVCEMSLDLKGCTLLVTDLAPVPALIQRLGRLNRQAAPAKDGKEAPLTRPFVVVEPDGPLPYTPAELQAARDWLSKLPEGRISQKQLADAWEQSADTLPELVPSAWLDGGPATMVRELREASPGVTVICSTDVAKAKGRELGKYTLPMPPPTRSVEWQKWGKERGIPVVPAPVDSYLTYDELRGAEWLRPTK